MKRVRRNARTIPDQEPRLAGERLLGLPPVIGAAPRVLVLGSMPGAESLRQREYYGHPRNHFWRIMEDALRIPRTLPYDARTDGLRQAGIALWDVLASCHRRGSLDADIRRADMQLNDVPGLLAAHSLLVSVVFNGAFAEKAFRQGFTDRSGSAGRCVLHRLPSTSPAHAAWDYGRKLAAWREALA